MKDAPSLGSDTNDEIVAKLCEIHGCCREMVLHWCEWSAARAGQKYFDEWLRDYFRAMRFDENHHLGLGDIRLTIGQQDELVVAAKRAFVGKPKA